MGVGVRRLKSSLTFSLYFKSPIYAKLVSCTVSPANRQIIWVEGSRPPNWGERVGLGVKNGPIRNCDIGFLLALYSDQTLSLTVFAEPSNVTDGQTDGQTDRIGIAIVDLMLRATRWHQSQKGTNVLCYTIVKTITVNRFQPNWVGRCKSPT